ncbi:MAG: 8-amino-7-oxononanoate synthase [Alphaproteobacteria bacterium]|nr:8-amino-7-oxononanoate synthase [Alphaproteobacteria bacterium]
MMNKFQNKLKQLEAASRLRGLNLPGGIDLTSNDYLGMRSHPKLRTLASEAIEGGIDLGSGGSRLLRGHTLYHESLESFAAAHFSCDRALYFATGFQANNALFTTLPSRHDAIIFDALVHASARDGIAASPARSIKVAHNDVQGFEDTARRVRDEGAQEIWIAVESLYSMDGDIVPLAELVEIAQKFEAWLIVDEAHASGVMGASGKGLCEGLSYERLITLHTCGKAIGVAGGLICAGASVIDYLVNAARPFIFSTAPPPLQAFLVEESLKILASEDGQARRAAAQKLCTYTKEQLGGAGTHIVPIIIGEDQKALEVAAALQDGGYDIRAIRPPTVPAGTARLRLSLSSELEQAILEKFFDSLKPLLHAKAA